mgnify:FL=1
MKVQLARIVEVVSGHSVRARIHAITEGGLELKLEVPLADAEGLAAGQILWLAWSVHTLPDAAPCARTEEAGPTRAASSGPPATGTQDDASGATPSSPSTSSQSLAALLGLRFDDSNDCA